MELILSKEKIISIHRIRAQVVLMGQRQSLRPIWGLSYNDNGAELTLRMEWKLHKWR